MAKKLKVLQEYTCRGEHYLPGATLDVMDEKAAWLLRDAPMAFEVQEAIAPVQTALDAPPADKMVRRARKK